MTTKKNSRRNNPVEKIQVDYDAAAPERFVLSSGLPEQSQTAAFLSGVLFNRLCFHGQQAWLGSEAHDQVMVIYRERFLAAARRLIVSNQQVEFEEQTRQLSSLRPDLKSNDYWKWYDDLADDLQDLELPVLPFLETAVLGQFFSTIEQLQFHVLSNCSREQGVAFRMGLELDQAYCPADVYRHVRAPSSSPVETITPAETGSERHWLDPELPCSEFQWAAPQLPNHFRNPGEVEPDKGWLRQIYHLWTEADIPQDRFCCSIKPGELHDCAQSMAVAVLQHILCSDQLNFPTLTSQERLRIPTRSQSPRLVIDFESGTVTFDGDLYENLNPRSLHILDFLRQKKGIAISQKDIAKQLFDNSSDKIVRTAIDKLPDDLKKLVQREIGKGTSLQLPAKKSTNP